MERDRLTDEQLLHGADSDPERFGVLYRRHERSMLGFFLRATGRGEFAVDLAAETFARAFEARRSYDPERGSAGAWLFGIARHVLTGSLRRGQVEASARARLGMARLVLDDRLVAEVEEVALSAVDDLVEEWLAQLPQDQRAAIRARVLEDRSYRDIAGELACSEGVVRQRVSRGLSSLRSEMEGTA
jgi:RNA polymerase sigma-70 factor (ECF subfamily)